jgi:DNA-binding transcriptional ArsR family regulator
MAKRKRKKKQASTVSVCGGPMDGVLVKALAHPTRAEILAFLAEQEIASPAEMTRASVGKKGGVGDPKKRKLASVAYHVRVLEELGLVELMDTRPVRGATEHFYEARGRMLLDIDQWSKLPKTAKNDVSIAALEETLALAGKAVSAGTFDSLNERAVINLTLRLDQEGFIHLAEDITEFMKVCEQRQSESVHRVEGNVDKLMYASTSLLLYESPPPRPPDAAHGKEASGQ